MKKVISLFLSLVMLLSVTAGLNFSAQAAEKIKTIQINDVPEPLIGATIEELMTFTVPIGAQYHGVSSTSIEKNIFWYDLDSVNPSAVLPADSVCVSGHRYKVIVRLLADGNSFDSNVAAYINGKAATKNPYGGYLASSRLEISYTFSKLDYKYISSVQLKAEEFNDSSAITDDFFYSNTDGVGQMISSFTRNGTVVPNGADITYGNYGVTIVMSPDSGYRFADGVTVKYEDKYFTVMKLGIGIVAKSEDDLFSINCEHSFGEYIYDETTHWKECENCGEKSLLESHSFNSGTIVGDVTTYTCNVCQYQYSKTDKNTENGFMYSDCSGGVQIIQYKGSDDNVTVPATLGGKKVVSIGEYAFANSLNKATITSITLPSSVTSIGRSAFNSCSALTSINIPSGVKRIENETFLGCSSLANISIPYGVNFIGESAFQGCGISSIVIPCSVKSIKGSAFRGCSNLGSVVVPDSVTELGNAFMACSGLKSVEIGDGITSIANSTFEACPALETLILPAGLKNIGRYNLDNKSNFNKIYFRGTTQQWNAVAIGSSNTNSAEIVYNYTEKTDVGQHKYSLLQKVAPTCVDEGYTLNICEGCGDSFKTDVKPATGVHTYNSGSVTKEPTCVDKGEKTIICKICGSGKVEDVKATGAHTYGAASVSKKATASANGQLVSTCTVCKNKKYTTIAKIKSVTLSASKYTFSGKEKKPSVTVKDSNGKTISSSNYSVSFAKGRKNVGKYSVKVTFKGNYSGTKTVYFTIVPKNTSLSKVTAGKKQFKATWKKYTTQTKGYQIQYSTDKNFKKGNKTVTVSNKTTSKTVKSLKAKKTYYVRIRTYNTVSKTNYYSAWSKAKSVKTK